ncbi:N/A [soil metagenome]
MPSNSPIEPAPEGATKQVRAAIRALDIIETIAAARALKHSDIAERLGIPKSTTTLILDTLVQSGYLQRDAMSRAYSLGSRILGIAGRYLAEMDIVQISQPVLSRLVVDVDESCFLVQAEGDEVIVLWREACKRRLTYTFSLGERAAITETAGGLALLACRDPQQWAPTLAACGPADADARRELLAQLERIADGGLAVQTHGQVREVSSLALPILGSFGKPLAALSVAVPASRLDAPLQARIEQALRQARDEIAAQAGYSGYGGYPRRS